MGKHLRHAGDKSCIPATEVRVAWTLLEQAVHIVHRGADGAVGGFRRRVVAAPLLHSDRQIGVAECGAPDRSDSEIKKGDIVAVASLLATPSESSRSFFRQ